MKSLITTAIAACAWMSWAAFAQSPATCPTLPVDTGLRWEQLDGPGFLFCKALREDGSEAFAVTVSRDSPFEPQRRNRAEETRIAGQPAWWYRSEIAGQEDAIAREALVEVDDRHVAHISLRAASEEQKRQAMEQVQALRFQDARLSSN
jgi:hypothetical protein